MPALQRSTTHQNGEILTKPKRVFTHTDLVTFFNTYYCQFPDVVYQLQKVSLLPEITVPVAWLLEYNVTYHHFDGDSTRTYQMIILQKERPDGTPYLNSTFAIAVPAGLATPQEED